jgi:hypothetical protein
MHTPPAIPNHYSSRLPNFVNSFANSLVERCDLLDSSSVNEAQILERLHELASQNVEQRLVSALQRLSHDRSLLTKDGSLKLEVRHHRLLCEMVGATRESITLALGRLVESGIARRNGTALFVASTVLDGHITDDMPINGTIPV